MFSLRINDHHPDIRTKAGFTVFYKTHFRFVFDICCRYIKDEEISLNIVSEIFTSIWERRKYLMNEKWEENSWKKYLTKSVKHKIYDNFRKKELAERHLSALLHELPHADNSTEKELYFKELTTHLESAISQLPPKSQQVFRLSREEGLSNHEIAEQLSMSMHAVKKHITRSLSFLKEKLSEFSTPNCATGS